MGEPPRLPGMLPDTRPRRTCPECETLQPAFHYGSRTPPYWYMIAHQHPGNVEQAGIGWCAGQGRPAVEQVDDA